MDDSQISELVKAHMRTLVASTNLFPSMYKYLTFDNAFAMLSAMNLQFTKAYKLNDEYEFDIRKCDFSRIEKTLKNCGLQDSLIKDKIEEANTFFKSIGVCSLGTSPNNSKLWDKYASSPNGETDGLCIEIDQHAVINNLLSHGYKTCALLVHYVDNVEKFLPWELYLGNQYERTIFLQLLYSTKDAAIWSEEEEIRLIYSQPFDGEYFRPTLSNKCIKAVYFGKDMSSSQRMRIGSLLNRYKNIKRIINT